jgi:hypothetical protein
MAYQFFSAISAKKKSTMIFKLCIVCLFTAVIKVLEGSVTPKLKRNRVTPSPLAVLEMTKKETGVWV